MITNFSKNVGSEKPTQRFDNATFLLFNENSTVTLTNWCMQRTLGHAKKKTSELNISLKQFPRKWDHETFSLPQIKIKSKSVWPDKQGGKNRMCTLSWSKNFTRKKPVLYWKNEIYRYIYTRFRRTICRRW